MTPGITKDFSISSTWQISLNFFLIPTSFTFTVTTEPLANFKKIFFHIILYNTFCFYELTSGLSSSSMESKG